MIGFMMIFGIGLAIVIAWIVVDKKIAQSFEDDDDV